MKRTISIKLQPNREQVNALKLPQKAFVETCNLIVPFARDDRCWNQVALHHKAYYAVRSQTVIGSQMICIAIKSVTSVYRALKIKKDQAAPTILFKDSGSVHLDKRTYSIKGNRLSLYTLDGRVLVPMVTGNFQSQYFNQGVPKEAELIFKKEHGF